MPGGRPALAVVPPKPAIAFDQIDRILLDGENRAKPDAFAADAATIASFPPLANRTESPGAAVGTTAGSMLVSAALGFVPIIGGLLAGAASRAMNAAQEATQKRQQEEQTAAVRIS